MASVRVKFTQDWKEFKEGETCEVSPNQANRAIHQLGVAVALQNTDSVGGDYFRSKNRMAGAYQRKG